MRPIPVNIRHEKCDVRVDRSSKFGNPFRAGIDGTRTEVIAKYKAWLWNQIVTGDITQDELTALAGKRIGCWCKPLPCHADVLASAVVWALSKHSDEGDCDV